MSYRLLILTAISSTAMAVQFGDKISFRMIESPPTRYFEFVKEKPSIDECDNCNAPDEAYFIAGPQMGKGEVQIGSSRFPILHVKTGKYLTVDSAGRLGLSTTNAAMFQFVEPSSGSSWFALKAGNYLGKSLVADTSDIKKAQYWYIETQE